MAALREQQVEVQLLRQALVQLHARVVEARALGRLVVRAQDRRVAPRRARPDVARLEDRDVADPVLLLQVVRGREAVRAAADDHDVVGPLEVALAPPHPLFSEYFKHAQLPPEAALPANPAWRGPRAVHRGARRRPRRPSTCTGRPPSRTGTGSGRRPRTRSGPAGAQSRPAAGPSTGVTFGRRSAAQKRANTSRASGPTSVIAANTVPTSTTLVCVRDALRPLADHERAVGRQRTPPGSVAAGGAPELEAGALGDALSPGARACPGARRRPTRPCSRTRVAPARASRTRSRRSIRRELRTARPPRAPGAPSGCARPRRRRLRRR